MRHTFAGLLNGLSAATRVRQRCRPTKTPGRYSCRWEVTGNVRAIDLDCVGYNQRSVLTRNMDNMRDKYPWRVTHFNLMTGEPEGHGWGMTPTDALNRNLSVGMQYGGRGGTVLKACKVRQVLT